MQDGVLDAADVLVHRIPVIVARVDHRLRAGTGVTHVIPGRVDEGVHGVGLALGGARTLRTRGVDEIGPLGERVAGSVGHAILRQHDRQIGLGDGYVTAGQAVDDGDGRAPVPLAGDAPIAQPIRDALFPESPGGEVGGDGLHRLVVGESVVLA